MYIAIYSEVSVTDTIYIDKKAFVDGEGRERIFRGMSFICEGDVSTFPRVYEPALDDEMLREYSENGFNLIRLGVVWDAVEHEMGRFDDNYTGKIADTIKRCEKFGIYVYIVIYQRHYASFMNGGVGAPLWATDTDNRTYMRVKYEASQLQYFFNPAVGNAFDNFWNNKRIAAKGLQDRYAEMINHILPFFTDKKAFLGIDFMNEPFPGSSCLRIFRSAVSTSLKCLVNEKKIGAPAVVRNYFKGVNRYDIFRLVESGETFNRIIDSAGNITADFDRKKYAPFFSKMADETAEAAGDSFIFEENNYCSNIGMPGEIPETGRNNVVFAPNGFDLTSGTTADESTANNMRTDIIWKRHKETQERLNCPVIVGAWGKHSGSDRGLSHISHELDVFDANKWSSAFFKYKPGIFRMPIADTLVRPYPVATAGTLDYFRYDAHCKIFELQYSQKRNAEIETVVYLPGKPTDIETDVNYIIEGNYLKAVTSTGVHRIRIKF
ncbi:MAG: cellulase family glycosylhydrolase [Clostridia bacterium]|nr:cellulase family glycosylhydrolase [Clostridia bacterium]